MCSITPIDSNPHYTIVHEKDRLDFIPNNFSIFLLWFEDVIVNIAEKQLGNYTGGYWEFAHTSNNAPFMFLKTSDELVTLSSADGCITRQLPTVLAGLAITSQAYQALLFKHRDSISEAHCDLYYHISEEGRRLAEAMEFSKEYFDLTN